jgi:hypothetical protein
VRHSFKDHSDHPAFNVVVQGRKIEEDGGGGRMKNRGRR